MRLVIKMKQEIEKRCCKANKHRTESEQAMFIKRLNIIEGQIKGVKEMVRNDRYCDDILVQICAIDKALKRFGAELLKNHILTCALEDIKEDRLEAVDDIVDLFEKLNR